MTGPRRIPPASALPPRRLAVLAAALAAVSCTLFHQDLPNVPPVVQVTEADTTQVRRGGRVSLRVAASDEDDDPLTYRWRAEAGSFTDSTANVTDWIAPNSVAGSSETFLVTVVIRDGDPETEDPVESFEIEVVQRPPVLRSVPASRTIADRDTVVLAARGVDEDGDVLTYLWLFRGAPASVEQGLRIRITDEAGEELATAFSLGGGYGVHDYDEGGTPRIVQRRSATERDSARVRFISLAAARHEIEVAVTDTVDTVSARFVIRAEAP